MDAQICARTVTRVLNPTNVIALDQENHGIVAVINGGAPVPFHPEHATRTLPAGGGIVVADANTWKVRNEYSVSQYCWDDHDQLETFLAALRTAGYEAVVVANKLAQSLYTRYGLAQPDAVIALYQYVHTQLQVARGTEPPPRAVTPPCGCTVHYSFDSGHVVRRSAGDRSFGERETVVRDFLRLQNTGGYASPFMEQAVAVVWDRFRTDPAARAALGLAMRTPTSSKVARIAAIVVCTHDPATGTLRTHHGKPWGTGFITRRVIGLNGAMRGTGAGTAGNPMRAVLRVRGMRWRWPADPAAPAAREIDRPARAALDALVRDVIRELRTHPQLPPA